MIRDDTDNVLIVRSSVSRALRSVGKGVALDLATSISQIYSVLRTGELQEIQIGGRKQWWIERSKLEGRTQPRYRATQRGFGRPARTSRRANSSRCRGASSESGAGKAMATEELETSEVVVHHLGH